jgi:hypothetical protein
MGFYGENGVFMGEIGVFMGFLLGKWSENG